MLKLTRVSFDERPPSPAYVIHSKIAAVYTDNGYTVVSMNSGENIIVEEPVDKIAKYISTKMYFDQNPQFDTVEQIAVEKDSSAFQAIEEAIFYSMKYLKDAIEKTDVDKFHVRNHYETTLKMISEISNRVAEVTLIDTAE